MSTHKVTGKIAHEEKSMLPPPNSQYEHVRSWSGDKLTRTTFQVYQKAQGVAHGHRLNIWFKNFMKHKREQDTLIHPDDQCRLSRIESEFTEIKAGTVLRSFPFTS